MLLHACKQTFHIFPVRKTQKVNIAINAKPFAYYFYVKTKTSVDLQICISVLLMTGVLLKGHNLSMYDL